MSSNFYSICNECETEFASRTSDDCPACGSPDLTICPIDTNPSKTWLREVIDTFADTKAPPIGHLVDCRYCGTVDFVRTRGSNDPTHHPCNSCKKVDALLLIASNTDELWCAKCWNGFGLATMIMRWMESQSTDDCCPLCDGDLIHPSAVSPGCEVIDDTPFFQSESFHPYALMLNENPGLEF